LVIGIAGLTPGQAGTVAASSGKPVLAISDGSTLSGWILSNTSSGSNTITYTVGSNSRLWLSVVEYGNTAASPLDGVAQANLSTSWQGGGFLNTPNFTTSSASDAVWAFCSGVAGAPTVGIAPIAWTGLPSPASGNLLVETGNAVSAGVYRGQCSSNEGEIVALALKSATAPAQAASPAFSLASGTYTGTQTVTISDATPGVTIYYTTNGAVPTTGSTVYSGSITVSTSETIEAIAASSSTTQSSISSAIYTINHVTTTPTINWPVPAPVIFGTALSSAQLNAASPVAGSFSYSPASGVLTAGSHTLTVTFTPTDTTDYTKATASVTLTVNKATPAINWGTPAAIPYGTPLSATQLNATSSAAGSFSYSPASGTLLAAGSQNLSTTFTPTDSADYSTATASVTLTVVPTAVAPVFVQQCNQFMQFGTTASCTLNGVGAGHTLVIGIAGAGTQTGKVTASAGTPTLAIKDASLLSAYLLPNTNAGKITITFTATANTRIYLTVAEYANKSTIPLDGAASFVSAGYSSTISTPKFTTTTPSDLLWSYCAVPSGYTMTPGKAPSLWTQRTSPAGSGYATLVEDTATTVPGAYYGQCSGPGTAWEIVTVAIKP
jgi:hypothetical protein